MGNFRIDGWGPGVQPGEVTLITVEDREAAEAAAAAAAESAAEAAASLGASVSGVSIVGDNLMLAKADGTVHDAGNARGPKGDKGNDGANVLPTDTAIAQEVNRVGSASRAAIIDLAGEGGGGPIDSDAITDATATGKSVITAADKAAARTAIGAGTSSLATGTSSSSAKPGDWKPKWSEVDEKPAYVASGTSKQAARDAIGAIASSNDTVKSLAWYPNLASLPTVGVAGTFYMIDAV